MLLLIQLVYLVPSKVVVTGLRPPACHPSRLTVDYLSQFSSVQIRSHHRERERRSLSLRPPHLVRKVDGDLPYILRVFSFE